MGNFLTELMVFLFSEVKNDVMPWDRECILQWNLCHVKYSSLSEPLVDTLEVEDTEVVGGRLNFVKICDYKSLLDVLISYSRELTNTELHRPAFLIPNWTVCRKQKQSKISGLLITSCQTLCTIDVYGE